MLYGRMGGQVQRFSYRIVSYCIVVLGTERNRFFFGVHRSLVSFPFFACALAVRKWLISLR
jgi:hypothetical protein